MEGGYDGMIDNWSGNGYLGNPQLSLQFPRGTTRTTTMAGLSVGFLSAGLQLDGTSIIPPPPRDDRLTRAAVVGDAQRRLVVLIRRIVCGNRRFRPDCPSLVVPSPLHCLALTAFLIRVEGAVPYTGLPPTPQGDASSTLPALGS